MVISSIGSVVGNAIFSIVALMFDIFPVIVFPINFSKYTEISIPKLVAFNLTALYRLSKVILPGITTEPCLKIWLPKSSIWFCKIDCEVVYSLAWTGNPGLNNTL